MSAQSEALRLADAIDPRNEDELFWRDREAAAEELRRLHATLERERMRLVACGVVALADTPDSAKHARQMHPDHESASCQVVARRVDECISLRAQRDALLEALKTVEWHGQGSCWVVDADKIAAAIKAAEENT